MPRPGGGADSDGPEDDGPAARPGRPSGGERARAGKEAQGPGGRLVSVAEWMWWEGGHFGSCLDHTVQRLAKEDPLRRLYVSGPAK